ncbi:MAG: DUF3500 domain-containing protein [Rhodospirillaceae bacterium]
MARPTKQAATAAAVILAGLISAAGPALSETPMDAAKRFAQTLSAGEQSALQPFQSADRAAVRLTPGRRSGLPLRDMDTDTRAAAFGLLQTLLSPRGMALVEAVRVRESRLAEIEGDANYRDKDGYTMALFGQPGPGDWGVRFEGHHLSINLAMKGGQPVSVLPFLIGANPPQGPQGDILLPFIRGAADPRVFRADLASAFQPGAPVPAPGGMEIDLVDSGLGHPHLSVAPR